MSNEYSFSETHSNGEHKLTCLAVTLKEHV